MGSTTAGVLTTLPVLCFATFGMRGARRGDRSACTG